jgi:hypothetical protein
MARYCALLVKARRSKEKIRVSFSGKIIPRLKLAILTLVLFSLAYVIVSKTIIALEFAQSPSTFVP